MKDQRTSCLGFWEPLAGISYMCLCVCTSVFVRVRALTRVFALARDCHLVGADLGLFCPVSFVVVRKTRVKVNSAFPFKSPN